MNSQGKISDLLGAYYERLKFIIEKGWWVLPTDVLKECDMNDKVLGLCHLITCNPLIVKETALLEKDMGIHATYLYSNIFPVENPIEEIAFLMSLGNEIGICAELLTPFVNENIHPHDTLRELIKPFKELNIVPRGIHCPNSPFAPLVKTGNYEYFSDFGEEKTLKLEMDMDGRSVRMGVHPMAEYGFTYAISRLDVVNEYDNYFEMIGAEDTGRSIIYLNTELWEVSA